jgi:hypothetical protein
VTLLALVLEFGFAMELFATTAIFGAFTLAIAYLIGEHEWRPRTREVILGLGISGAVAAILLSPYLFHFPVRFPSRGNSVGPRIIPRTS